MVHFSVIPFRVAVVRPLLALLLLVIHLSAAAQAPAWQSAQAVAAATAAATGNSSTVTGTAVDAAGNVFLAGYFTNTVVLGSIALTSLGGSDVFVAKFDAASNQCVWAQRAGGTGEERTYALAVSGTSVYVVGAFASPTAGFGAMTLANTGGMYSYDVFVAKFTDAGPTGNCTWAQRAGGTGEDYATALAVSGTSVYVAGTLVGPTSGFGTAILTNAGTAGVFVAKLTDAGPTGRFEWVQQAGAGANEATALAVSGTSVYVAGFFTSTTTRFGAITLTNAGNIDVFVAKLTDAGPTGSFVWAQRAGGTGNDHAMALAVSGPNVYMTGFFDSSSADFGAATLATTNLYDVFVAKLTDAGSTGSFGWVQGAA